MTTESYQKILLIIKEVKIMRVLQNRLFFQEGKNRGANEAARLSLIKQVKHQQSVVDKAIIDFEVEQVSLNLFESQ